MKKKRKKINFVKKDKTRNELFNEYIWPERNYVWAIAKDKYEAKSHDDTNEAYQECLIVLLKGIHTFNPEKADLIGWISVCSRRHIKKMNDTLGKKYGQIDFNANDLTTHHVTDTENVHLYCEGNMFVTEDNMEMTIGDELLNVFNGFDDSQKETFKMRFFDHLKYREIVKIVNDKSNVKVSESAVKSRIAGIRHPIVEKLERYYESKDY